MTASLHAAHGLAGDSLPPDWPPLDEKELAALLSRFHGMHGRLEVQWRSPRPLSAAALVGTGAGPVFVKRHHRAVRTPAQLAEEHAFAGHLRAGGVPVPEVLRDAHGETAIGMGDWVYEVHAPARGVDAYRDAYSWMPLASEAHGLAAGRALGRLHRVALGYEAPQRTSHVLVARAEVLMSSDPVATLETQLADRPALVRYLAGQRWGAALAEAVAPWHARASAGLARQPACWTHGDWHASNLCWSSAGPHAEVTDVLDFGLCARTFGLFDLATAIERNAIAWLDPDPAQWGRPRLARALIAGYAQEVPLDGDAMALLCDLLPLVHVDFALSEVEYFEGITCRRDHADVAWHTFLLGHAAWFRTAAGAAFLRDIQAPAPSSVLQ